MNQLTHDNGMLLHMAACHGKLEVVEQLVIFDGKWQENG